MTLLSAKFRRGSHSTTEAGHIESLPIISQLKCSVRVEQDLLVLLSRGVVAIAQDLFASVGLKDADIWSRHSKRDTAVRKAAVTISLQCLKHALEAFISRPALRCLGPYLTGYGRSLTTRVAC